MAISSCCIPKGSAAPLHIQCVIFILLNKPHLKKDFGMSVKQSINPGYKKQTQLLVQPLQGPFKVIAYH